MFILPFLGASFILLKYSRGKDQQELCDVFFCKWINVIKLNRQILRHLDLMLTTLSVLVDKFKNRITEAFCFSSGLILILLTILYFM